MNLQHHNHSEKRKVERKVKCLLVIFISGLAVSGITALPIQTELEAASEVILRHQWQNALTEWIQWATLGVAQTNLNYPFIAYGTDWLAFAHLVLAVAFIGAWRDPVRNIWLIEFGLIACAAVVPFSLIAGELRGIPLFWRMFDSLFGITGGLILVICYHMIRKLETLTGNR